LTTKTYYAFFVTVLASLSSMGLGRATRLQSSHGRENKVDKDNGKDLDTLVTIAEEFMMMRYHNEPSDYEAMPMIFATAEEGLYVMPAPWANDDQKRNMLKNARRVFAASDVSAYAILCEGWLASVDMTKNPELAKVMPRDRMDRLEVASIYAADKDGRIVVKQFIINRDGDRIALTPHDLGQNEPGAKLAGTLVTLLEDLPTLSELERQSIREVVSRSVVSRAGGHKYNN
jgi:hypothetical protein